MASNEDLEKLCGSTFWDFYGAWNTTDPHLTPCFQETVLVWTPCIFLWLFAILEINIIKNSHDKLIPWTFLNLTKLVCSGVLLVLHLADLIYQIVQDSDNSGDVSPNDFLVPVLFFMSILLQVIFVVFEKHYGIQSSGYLFLFWLLMAVCGISQYRSYFIFYPEEVEVWDFVVYNIHYPLTVVMLILNCFADARPKHVDYPRGERACPEPDSSFLSRITFSWLDRLVWRGFKHALVQTDLWDLTRNNASSTVVRKWDRNWEKSKEQAHKKGKSKTRATYDKETERVSVTGSAGDDKPYVSVLPTMIKTFGPQFLAGSALKLVYDILQFVSPQILNRLIDFTEASTDTTPDWQGYFYAVLMFVCAQVASFILGQYFMKTFLVGLRIRTGVISAVYRKVRMTGVISAVYRKALKISSSSRKESTVGEIVNLMSVDAQRFMDLTTYLNMLWSAPLQIFLSLYFLWNILGASVLAGLAVLLLLIPINGVIANMVKKLQIKQMKFKDKRVKMMNEILNGMKVLKLYAWEPSFENQVLAIRQKEIDVLKRAAYLNAVTSFVFTCTPFLVTFAMFFFYVMIDPDGTHLLTPDKVFVSVTLLNILRMPMAMLPFLIVGTVQVLFAILTTYSLLGNVFSPSAVFVSFTYLNILRVPMGLLPIFIAYTFQANVSLKRLNKFLNLDELDPSAVSREPSPGSVIEVTNGTFAWGHDKDDSDILKSLNLKVKPGALVAVVGTVGAGKTSLCSALLGDMEKKSGRVNVQGRIAYVPQQAWIQNCTLRDNILFGAEFNEKTYEKVLDACALLPDLSILPGGDQTEIGEKGINLSGGQKQRVSLARAVYSDFDIFMLDDPLSAVDSHVGKHIFTKVIGPEGILKDKTRLLVTHSISYLPATDHIIVMKDGFISEQGSYQELIDNKGEFHEFLLQHLAEAMEEEVEPPAELSDIKTALEKKIGRDALQRQLSRQRRESENDGDNNEPAVEESLKQDDDVPLIPDGLDAVSNHSTNSLRRRTSRISESSVAPKPPALAATGDALKAKIGEKIIETEKAETGKVTWSVYGYYLRAIGVVVSLFTVFFYVGSQACMVASNMWLSRWSEDETSNDPGRRDMYLGVYGGLGVGQAVFILFGAFSLSMGCLNAGFELHSSLLSNILHLPMHFFETNPLGRIINRFSKDIDCLDNTLPWVLRSWLICFCTVVATFFVIIYSTPIFIAVMIPCLIIYYFIQSLYVATSRQLKRIESVSRSPIYSHFGETVQGASTIRAYGKQTEFILDSEKRVDTNQVSYYPSVMANRWLAIRLELIGNLMTFSAAIFAVLARGTITAGTVGLSISYALSVTQTLNWLVRMTSDVETNIVSVERVKEYSETPQEAPWEVQQNKPQKDWPEEGVVKFSKFSTRYREGLEFVVKDIDVTIQSGEKVGIVGRTGAGKSSLTLALFRIIEAAVGHIIIDGIDIAKIGLHDLRSRLTIIPQDPVLFSGSLRMNLDPFEQFSDESVWNSLEQAHLKAFVKGLPQGLQHEAAEGGENLSVGQRQLVCLARALLRKTRVLVLDEATAAVDLETDDLIQKTIREQFSSCTIITIAHRLNTIMDSNRVLVLDKGEVKEFAPPNELLKNKQSLFYSMAKDSGIVS
ncbi:ABC transporter-like [Trinorchestia longiramus]|nr:ABC transporter-like [Trinorchestia longiramus]